MILRPDRIDLAEHSTFDGVEKVVEHGADIVPKMTTVRKFEKTRTVGDTQEGERLRGLIGDLEELVKAYQEGLIAEAR